MLVCHHLGTVESWKDVDEELACFGEISYYQSVDSLVYFQFVLALPITPLLQQTITLINILLYLMSILISKVDGNKAESDVHFFTYLDSVLEGLVEGLDGLGVAMVVVVEFCLLEDGVTDLGLAEVLLGVLYFELFLG